LIAPPSGENEITYNNKPEAYYYDYTQIRLRKIDHSLDKHSFILKDITKLLQHMTAHHSDTFNNDTLTLQFNGIGDVDVEFASKESGGNAPRLDLILGPMKEGALEQDGKSFTGPDKDPSPAPDSGPESDFTPPVDIGGRL